MDLENVEEFYPLTPVQQGLLFHSQAEASSAYVGQLAFTLVGRIEVATIESAWRALIARHAVLRSFFVWEAVDEPIQVVQRHVALPFEVHDYRHLEGKQEELLEHWLKSDLQRGLDLDKAPVMRVTLIRLSEERWRIVWTHHHILIDGWSVPLLLNELFALCAAPDGSVAGQLPARRPYRDYIAWLAKQDSDCAREHWRRVLEGFHSPIALGDHVPRVAESGHAGWEHEIRTDEDTLRRIRQYSRRHRVTINTIIQGAWAILLSRYSDQNDIVFGATVSGRPPDLEGAQEMIGLFINTLPVRVRIDETRPVVELLQRIQNEQAQSRQFEYTPLVDVQRWSQVARGTPLFDSILVFENYPGGEHNGAVTVEDGEFREQTNYAFTLIAAVTDKLVLRCLHDPVKVSAGAAVVVLKHLRRVIEVIVGSEGLRLGAIEPLMPQERQLSVYDWNDTATRFCPWEAIPQCFAAQVQASPERVALVAHDATLTYQQLESQSNRLARYLQRNGAATESVVALYLERGASAVITLMAILKAGAAYLPLDLTSPQARTEAIVRDAAPALIVTTRSYADRFAGLDCHVVELDSESSAIASQPADPPDVVIDGRNLAYLIYTSGSTGQPKGVMAEHRSVVNLAYGQIRAFGITGVTRTLQFASLSFDASVSEIFCALLSGSELHIPARETSGAGADLAHQLRTRKITLVTLPPSLLSVLEVVDQPTLATVVTAGEACPSGVVARWAPGRRFLNAYGPTETTVCATVTGRLQGTGPVHIGKPLANARVYILDSGLRPVPIGVVGEIYVGGIGLARGYAGKPDLTAGRFVPDPFSTIPGCRMYATGDRARHLPDGCIEYLGRTDFQVKLRGFRVELGEIEATLEKDPTVSQACVLAREVAPNDRRLIAYVTPRGDTVLEPNRLLATLRAQLPDYAVPSALLVLNSLPLTRSGKIDRSALPEPAERGQVDAEYVVPRNDTEQRIAAIWCEVLHLESVGVHDNFFELGGHSLSLFKVHGKLKTAFRKELPLIQMFSFPTIAMLAGYFDQDDVAQLDLASVKARAVRARQALSLSEQGAQ